MSLTAVRAVGLCMLAVPIELGVRLPGAGAPSWLAVAVVLLSSVSALALALRPRRPVLAAAIPLIVAIAFAYGVGRNHLYLMAIVVTILGLFSPVWHAPMIRLQTSIVYGYAALAKLNGTYLSGARLDADLAENPVRIALGLPLSLTPALAVASVAAEGVLAIGLWFPRTRPATRLVGLALHAGIVALAWSAPLVYVELVAFNALLIAMWSSFRGFEPSDGLLQPSGRRSDTDPTGAPASTAEAPER